MNNSPFTIKNSIAAVTPQLSLISDHARLETERLLSQVLGVTRSHLQAWPDKVLTTEQLNQFHSLCHRRCQGEPLAYLTGYREFWSLNLRVTPATLIPRPETELLVEQVLTLLPTTNEIKIIDLGTGSGAIALALARERPQWHIIATDYRQDTLAIAQENAQRLKIANVQFLLSDWFTELKGIEVHLIVSNPPYIAEQDAHLSQLRYEPLSALIGGTDGLLHLRHLIANAQSYLLNQGWLLLEHGYQQAEAVQPLLRQQGYIAIKTYQDLARLPRVTVGQKFSHSRVSGNPNF